VCDANEYNPSTASANSNASLPLTQIVGHTQTFTDFLNNNQPNGGTPTIAALQGSYNYATSVKAASPPGGVTYVVLITDGAPGFGVVLPDGGIKGDPGCPGNAMTPTPSPIVQLTQNYFNQGISTYVFGMAGVSGLNAIATAGGTSFVGINANDPASTTQDFIRVLNSIPKPVFDCNYRIENYASADLDKVNVFYTNDKSGDQHLIYNNPSCGLGDKTGWYMDKTKTPPEIVLCTPTCDALKADPSSALNVQFGCPVVVINY
jgi:hypothetical protein